LLEQLVSNRIHATAVWRCHYLHALGAAHAGPMTRAAKPLYHKPFYNTAEDAMKLAGSIESIRQAVAV
jgi:hypothetical protein